MYNIYVLKMTLLFEINYKNIKNIIKKMERNKDSDDYIQFIQVLTLG